MTVLVEIPPGVIQRARQYWQVGVHTGRTSNKVRAIKHVREQLTSDLKTAKDLVESDFSTSVCSHYGFIPNNGNDPDYWVDRIIQLSSEIAACYHELEELGFTLKR